MRRRSFGSSSSKKSSEEERIIKSRSKKEAIKTAKEKEKKMLPEDELFSMPLRYLVFLCCSFPLGGMLICVLLALTIHFDGATRTHCGVVNFLPSISASIGDFTPERYIWRICIALHCMPRFATPFVYKNYFMSSPLRRLQSIESHWLMYLSWLLCFLHMCENFFLVALTCVSSTENHGFHEFAFTSFVVVAMCYMLLNVYLFHHSGRRRSSSSGEKSFQYKLLMFSLSLISLFFSAYFYYRHNAYCEPGVYTLFAAAEYAVVITNILFHGTCYYDFYDKKISLISMNSLDSLLTTSSVDWKAT